MLDLHEKIDGHEKGGFSLGQFAPPIPPSSSHIYFRETKLVDLTTFVDDVSWRKFFARGEKSPLEEDSFVSRGEASLLKQRAE